MSNKSSIYPDFGPPRDDGSVGGVAEGFSSSDPTASLIHLLFDVTGTVLGILESLSVGDEPARTFWL